MQNIIDFLNECQNLYSTGSTTEHSYRRPLENLLNSIDEKYKAINEPKRTSVGAPDFIIIKNDVQVAFLEAKDIDKNLDDKQYKDQIGRYQNLGNLCFTNNLDWKFYEGDQLVSEVSIGKLENGKIQFYKDKFDILQSYLDEFVHKKTRTINSAKGLATIMAKKALLMKHVFEKALSQSIENEIQTTLSQEYESFKTLLVHDLKVSEFADIYAQTVAYGFFTARFYDDSLDTFSRYEAAEKLPKSNPFLRNLFQLIAGFNPNDEIVWVIDNLVEIFSHTDVKELMKGFGSRTSMKDPVLHFYETFLSEYNPKARKQMGVYYTPDPVVKFIVKSVDEILKNDFGIKDGLADNSKVQQSILKNDAMGRSDIVREQKGNHTRYFKEYHKVQVLDPATGTGTFLLEVFNLIYKRFENNQGIWKSYAKKDLVPRIHGFELLMASYTMAHLKLAMFLSDTGVELDSDQRLSVYLTNSLEESVDQGFDLFSRWLTEESEEASKIKNENPVMVIVGNPPYSVSSSNKGKWIQNLVQDYKEGLNERNIQPLSDDYIKFIRYGQHLINKNGEGILAFISNNSFLDGIIHRQMRKQLLDEFDKIYVIDLHGNLKKREVALDGSKDQNVFDIQQGVSINIFVKRGQKKSRKVSDVKHIDLYGKRDHKYKTLENNTIKTLEFSTLIPDEKYHFFVPKDFSGQERFDQGIKICDIFTKWSSGVKTHSDKNLVSIDTIDSKYNKTYSYRPLETRFIEFDLNKVVRPRMPLMGSMDQPNIALNVCKQQSAFDFQHCLVSQYITDICYISSQTKESAYTFPLLNYPEDSLKPKLNFNSEVITKIENLLSLSLKWEATIDDNTTKSKDGDLREFSAIDLLDYIYGVLHSPNYRKKYKEFLKIDFPRIPFDVTLEEFWQFVKYGSKLRELHLMKGELNTAIGYPIEGTNIVEKPVFKDGKVYINSTQYFDNIPEIAWNFYIGGYQPAQKWLNDRKGKELEYEDILHYQKVISILFETDKIMKMIDEIKAF